MRGVGEEETGRQRRSAHGARITLVSTLVLVTVSLCVALAVGAVALRHLLDGERRAVGLVLDERERVLARGLAWRLNEVEAVATRLAYVARQPRDARFDLGNVMALLSRTSDFHALSVVRADGTRLAGFGPEAPDGEPLFVLRTRLPSELLWDGHLVLQVRAPFTLADGTLLEVRAWGPLTAFSEAMHDVRGLRDSGEVFICGIGTAEALQCLPTRHHAEPFMAESAPADQQLPVARALAGEHGTSFGRDYRGVEVLAAFKPVAQTGLGIVAKLDVAELYPALLRDLAPVPLLWLGMVLLGLLLIRLQVVPLIRNLVRTEYHYRALVEASPDWVWEVDRDGLYTYSNPGVVALLGYGPEELVGRSPFELMPPAEAARLKALFHDITARQQPFHALESVGLHKDGRRVVLESSGAPLYDGEGRWCGYHGSARDVTAQQQVIEALRHSELKFRTVVEQASDGIVLLGRDRRFLELNDAACRLLGGSREQLLGLRPDDLLQADNVAEMLRTVVALQQGGSARTLRHLRRLDGHAITVEVSSQGLSDGRVISLLRDVTRQHEQAQELQRSEQLKRTIVEVLAEGVVVHDVSGAIVEINQAAAAMLGQDGSEVRGRDSLDPVWAVIHEDGSPFPGETHPAMVTLRSGQPQRGVIMGVLRPNGQRVWLSVNSAVLRDGAAGEPLGVVASFQDISVQRELEQVLRGSRERLRVLTSHLQQVREEEKATIAREVHDELGSTLTALKMDGAWLQRALSPAQPRLHEKLDAMMALVDSAVASVRRIVTELRPTVLYDLGLRVAIEWLVNDFASRSGLRCSLGLYCDEIALSEPAALAVFRALQESLTNVARHAQATTLHVDCWIDDALFHLTVNDDGIGMPDDKETAVTSFGIRGMYERLGEVGGRLSYHGAPGEGTLIEMEVPLMAPEGDAE
ncbi:MAG: PAS domain S-box protein [Gammaproteobacteria bacterium]|nr:PAS domain S-box protein [Gammaproteobacteria bacterium]